MTECNHKEEHAFSAERAKANMPSEEAVERVCASFKAFSEPSRMKIQIGRASCRERV